LRSLARFFPPIGPVIARAIDFAGLKREKPRLLLRDQIPCNRFTRYFGCALIRVRIVPQSGAGTRDENIKRAAGGATLITEIVNCG